MDTFDHIFQTLTPLKSEAQIILELDSGVFSLSQIREILGSIHFEIMDYKSLAQNQLTYLKIILPRSELQKVMLQLTGAGISKIMGLDAAF